MPPARQTSAARSHRSAQQVRQTPRSRPRPVTHRLPTSKVGWDRKFRFVMIGVFLLVSWMAVQAAVSVISAHSQAAAEIATVQRYSRENHRLDRQESSLKQRTTILRVARELGMVRPGEYSYVVTGLPPEGH